MKKTIIWFGLFLLIISVNIEAQRIRSIDMLGFAKKLFEDEFYMISLEEFKQFLNDHPESESAYIAQYYVGECYFRMNDFRNAGEQFLILTARYPDAPNAVLGWEGMGRCYEKMNNFKKAAEIFETAGNFFFYKGDVASPFFLYAGKGYLKIGNIKKAKENFLRIVDNYPGSEPAYEATYQLGLLYLKQEDALSALKEFEKVEYFEEKPLLAAGSRLLSGKIYMKIGDFEKSENEFKYIIENYKSNIDCFNDARLNLGITYILGGSYNKGRDLLVELTENTNLSDSLLIRGMIAIGESYFYEENYLQAESEFIKLIEEYPLSSTTGEIFYKLGLCFEREGNEEQAIYNFRRSVEYSKSDGYLDVFQKKSLDKLINFYEQKKQYKEAANYMERFSNYIDEGSESHLIKTASFYEKGMDFVSAARIYGIIEEKFLKSPNIDYYIFKKGICLEKGSLIREAKKEYKKLMDDFAGCDYADEINFRLSLLENLNLEEGQDRFRLFELLNPVERRSKIDDNADIKRAFEIGKYYYNINKFSKSIIYFKIVLDSEKDEETLKKAGEFIALSYDNIAKRYYIDGELQEYNTYLDSALYAYKDCLEDGYFTKDFLDYAKIRIAEISIEKEEDRLEKKRKGMSFYTLLNDDKEFSMRDFVLLRLGEIYTAPDDSSEINELQIRRDYFNELITVFPNSKYAEKAKFELGYSHYISDELDKASEIFKKYLIEYPSGMYAPAVTAYLGKIKLNSDNESSELFKLLSEKFYYSSYVDSTLQQWGDFYFNKGNFKEAVEKYLHAFKRAEVEMLVEDKDIEDKIMDLSMKITSAYDSLGNFDKAIVFLNDLIDKGKVKNISHIYYALGKIYEDSNYNNKAVEIYKKIEEEFPEEEFTKDVLKRKSEMLFGMEKFTAAYEGYEKIAEITENPTEKIKYLLKAIISLYRNNEIQKGDEEVKIFLKEYKNLNNINFYKYQFLLEKGKSYYRSKNFKTAQKTFEDVAKNGEKTEIAPEAELYIGLIYQSRKDKVEALKHFNSIKTEFPDAKIWDKVYNTLGLYYYGIGQVAEAARHFRMAIENSSGGENRDVFNNLILSYRHSEWFDSEIDALRRYVRLFPEADDIFDKKFNIGRALVDIGDYKSAIERLKPLLALATLEGEVEIQMKIAEAYEGLGNDEKAISEWLKVLYYGRSTIPKLNTTVRFRLAGICERVGMYDKALQFYEEIVEKEGATTDFGRFANQGMERVKERIKSIGGYKNH